MRCEPPTDVYTLCVSALVPAWGKTWSFRPLMQIFPHNRCFAFVDIQVHQTILPFLLFCSSLSLSCTRILIWPAWYLRCLGKAPLASILQYCSLPALGLLVNQSLFLSLPLCPRFFEGVSNMMPRRIVLVSTFDSFNSSRRFLSG